MSAATPGCVTFKHTTPLVFNECTHDDSPNISPRGNDSDGSDEDEDDEIRFKDDKKIVSKIEKFNYSNKSFRDFIIHIRKTVLIKKPENILDFLVDDYFSGDSLIELRILFDQKK